MRRLITALIIGSWLVPACAMVGCDKTLEHQKTVEEKNDGTTVTHEKNVTESPNGTVTKTDEQKVDK